MGSRSKIINCWEVDPDPYLNFGEAIKAVMDGKKVTMIEWPCNHRIFWTQDGERIDDGERPDYLKMLRTNEPDEDNNGNMIINQPYIAKFYYNGGYMPHAYVPDQYDIIAGQFKIIE